MPTKFSPSGPLPTMITETVDASSQNGTSTDSFGDHEASMLIAAGLATSLVDQGQAKATRRDFTVLVLVRVAAARFAGVLLLDSHTPADWLPRPAQPECLFGVGRPEVPLPLVATFCHKPQPRAILTQPWGIPPLRIQC